MDIFRRLSKWLLPGMKIKRWIFLSWAGLIILSIGLILYIKITPLIDLEMAIVDFLQKTTGNVITTESVDIGFIVSGIIVLLIGLQQWINSIYKAVVPYERRSLVDVIYENRQMNQGPKIVTIGGGTGLSSLLRGLKAYSSNITAVVTVSDDGGSSGRLRKEMGVLPPGDIRNCLVALADEENLMGELFQYRFSDGDSLEGHSFGNLFLVALTAVTGDFDKAIKQSSRILAVKGRVLPATLCPVTLGALMEDGCVVEGECAITEDERKIDRIFLRPADCKPPQEVINAILEADIVILGPGSLYTSVLPNLVLNGVVEAINKTSAATVYVCNVMTQPGETDDFAASDHVRALLRQAPGLQIDHCLVNDEIPPSRLLDKYRLENQFPVKADIEEIRKTGVNPVAASFISVTDLVRHDPEKLSERIARLLTEELQTER